MDNLSGLSPELSDCLCRLSTGGGIDLRALFTDSDQVLVDIQRPVMVNGIDDIATRPDLAERALILNLPVIEDKNRKSENEFWAGFESDKAKIFGAILGAVSTGLRHRNNIKLRTKPRMADAAIWITACEKGFDHTTTFIQAHSKNQQEAVELGIEASPIGAALAALMADKNQWTGTPTDLFKELGQVAGESQTRSKAWPHSTKGMKGILRRLASSFRRLGINLEQETSGNRLYTITNDIPKVGLQPPYPPQPPETAPIKALVDSAIHRQPPETASYPPLTAVSATYPQEQNPINTGTLAVTALAAGKNPPWGNAIDEGEI
jgi:hypothetical protein